ncbi:MMPL family transporter [Microtetraspora niveoalba]|uniref:MMPL family transporter n=1 Tax=Microtetraspora niveoalba TaxID=46175 RepID=UPI00082DB7F8|nr:MMPL family transporter [Microtetraspora niveoalba]
MTMSVGAAGRRGTALTGRGRAVIAAWLLAAVVSALSLPGLMARLSPPSLQVPGSRSETASALIARGFPQFGTEQMILVFDSASLRAADPAYQRAVGATMRGLAARPEIDAMLPLPVVEGQDPRRAYVAFGVTGDEAARHRRLPTQIAAARDAVRTASGGAVTVTVVGVTAVFADLIRSDLDDLRRIETFTVPAVVLLLVLGLGSAGAAVVPLLVAGAAMLVSAGVLSLASVFGQVDPTLLTVAVTVCLGVGLDYALLILLRYRQARREGNLPPAAAAVRARVTAGGTVAWCATAIMLTAAALFVIPVSWIRHVALAAMLAVFVTAAAALSLTPVLLRWLDPWLEWGRLPWRRSGSAASGSLWRRSGSAASGPPWLRLAGHLMDHPVRYALAVAALLLVAALPVLDLRLGLHYDRGSLAGTDSGGGLARMEADRMAGLTGLALPHPAGSGPVGTAALTDALEADPRVGPVAALDNGRDLTLVLVAERNAPDSDASAALLRRVHELGTRLLPPGQPMYAAGPTALLADLGEQVRAGLGQVVAVVLLSSFVLLLVTFRSPLIAAKAVGMNVLSIAATFGLLALCFQNAGQAGDVNLLVPLLTFTVVFGLSMDYEVFLVHRIAEHYRRTGDNTAAVLHGLRHTARPITLAAAVMTATFAGLLFTHRGDLQQTGFAVAVAVAVDATLIRMILVPALMRLLGHRNWWLPGPLARLLPRVPSGDLPAGAPARS